MWHSCLFLSAVYPPAIFVVTLFCFLTYIIKKYLFLRRYNRPFSASSSIYFYSISNIQKGIYTYAGGSIIIRVISQVGNGYQEQVMPGVILIAVGLLVSETGLEFIPFLCFCRNKVKVDQSKVLYKRSGVDESYAFSNPADKTGQPTIINKTNKKSTMIFGSKLSLV